MYRVLTALLFSGILASAQSVTSEILGTIQDQSGAALAGARVTATNEQTGLSKEATTDDQGRFRITLLPPGLYRVKAERTGFTTHSEGPFEIRLNQAAELNWKLQVGAVSEAVSVTGDAPVINTTTSEISTTFESKRISELPLATNRNMYNLALNVAGVSQLSSGQQGFANGDSLGNGVQMAVNGMRLRSNNFMVDGQDVNDPSVTGVTQNINNPDIVSEFRVITNQFAAEYGRAAGAIVNVVTKSGTNSFHGSAFYFNNNSAFNTRSNLDKVRAQQPEKTPFRNETQLGATIGGPIVHDRTFFFGSYQRWWDRRLGVGPSVDGPLTAEAQAILRPFATNRPALRALLDYVPAANPAGIAPESVTIDGQTLSVPRGRLSGTQNRAINDHQFSGRVDHRLSEKHQLGGRYMFDDAVDAGTQQLTPAGYATDNPQRNQAAMAYLNSTLAPTLYNEIRLAYMRQATSSNPQSLRSTEIPSMEVNTLGLTGFNNNASRTGFGAAVNLPQFRRNNTYQIQENLGWLKGSHNLKFGLDFRRTHLVSFFVPTIRGRLAYNNLQDLVDDVAQSTQINGPIPGGQTNQYYDFYDYYFYAQDEWRIHPSFTLNYGIRYESPGNPFNDLANLNERIIAANGNDPRYRGSYPGRDTNNWQPRFGFNYKLPHIGWLTGDGKTVIRGGYARTYDVAFLNIALNVFSAFPFLNSVSLAPRTANSFTTLASAINQPISNPNLATRTNVAPDFKSPMADQFSFNIQRQFLTDWAFTAGWVATKGSSLFQTLDGNPVAQIRAQTVNDSTGAVAFQLAQRVRPDFGVIRTRANTASSIYHSLQLSMEKRYSHGFLLGAHYTWSAFIDTASELFNPAVNGDVAIPQDSYNWRNDRGRSTYDRPQRFTLTHTWEIPAGGALGSSPFGKIFGGWQLNGFLTFQSGPPFTALNGSDPFLRVGGIDGLVGNSIRPNVVTNLDVSGMRIEDLYSVRTSLFRPVVANTATLGPITPGQVLPVAPSMLGNAGRNILRADGIGRYDFGVNKNIRMTESQTLQFRMDVFNLTNTKNFGIPESRVNAAQFLNQWGTDGGNRRIQFGVRYVF